MKKFDKDSYLRKLKLKRWIQNYSRYLYISVSCLFVCMISIYFAYFKFFVKQEIEVVRTTVGEFKNGYIVLNIYVDNEKVEAAPKRVEGYAFDQVSCDNDAEGTWNNDTWSLLVTKLTGKTKCNIYFKKIESKVPDIIAQLDTTGKCPTVNADGTVKVTAGESTDGYLCKAKGTYGDSYYYRGTVTNNYVKFAGFYWCIVRINGDRSVRVIYDGTIAHANGTSRSDGYIGTTKFNDALNNSNSHVGYMYGSTKATTYAGAHANTNDSTIKKKVDDWYKTNILCTAYEQYLTDNIFYNDRSISRGVPSDGDYNNLGYAKNVTAYRWHYFATSSYNSKMMLTCPQQNDAFTVSDTTNGNGALTYPIAVLSVDEVILAGGWNVTNQKYYLCSGQGWWTASPNVFSGTYANVLYVNSIGNASTGNSVGLTQGIRPVINLKLEALKNGDGTMENPYEP